MTADRFPSHALTDADLAVRERRLAIAVLSAEIAHEIATPLLFLRDIVAHGNLDEEDRRAGREEIARLEALLARLRRAKRSEAKRSNVALRTLAEATLGRLADLTAKELRVLLDVPEGLRLDAHEESVELLLLSLTRNAAAAAPVGGRIAVRTHEVASMLVLEIEDDGPGLSPELSEVVFRPLATLHDGGAGLGLPMVLRIARDHGWHVTYAREPGATVFRVEIPKSDPRTRP